jgi:arylsulfatase A-like enzyme
MFSCFLSLSFLFLASGLCTLMAATGQRPNILWLSSEDHGPHLGCYGDNYASTPNLDAFAKQSLLYQNAISTAPVCAPARTTIICGMYAPSLGAHHMRSQASKPEWLKFYPEFLREAGYYCTNNSKTDYNIDHNLKQIWDESSGKAHYQKRKKGQPFFAIFNQTCTHESRIRARNSKTRHDPSKVPLPPYHPDIPVVRDNWAQYYDRLTEMDDWFGGHLRALKEQRLYEDTIVIFWADHGSGMPRGKRYAGWSGLHVPMIVHIPEKWKHLRPPEYKPGNTSDRLVGFVDLGATMLSLAGIKPAAFQQGKAFLGKYVTPKPEYSFGFRGRMDERPDCSRTVVDGKYVYIRNFMPHLPHGQILHYQMETQTTRLWRRLFHQGKLNKVQSAFWEKKAPEELYDITADPHETNNLATDPACRKQLLGMRAALYDNLSATFDVALLPEGMFHDLARKHGVTPADLTRRKNFYSVPEIRKAADLLLEPELKVDQVADMLKARLPSQRYWAVLACLYRGEHLTRALDAELGQLFDDPSRSVQIAAAEALATHPRDEQQRSKALEILLENSDPTASSAYHAVAALNALDHQPRAILEPLKDRILKLPTKDPNVAGRPNGYAGRMHKHIATPIPDFFPWEKK